MENGTLSAASGPFVDCHAFETAFAPRHLRNSWKLEYFYLPENHPRTRPK